MESVMLGMYAETAVHAGAGRSVGVIDLPIMREAHTGWPCVYASAMKGASRALAQARGMEALQEVFGPDTNNASDHAGALLVGDARLLLLPIRSLTSHFKWVTCPALLRRAVADARRMGLDLSALATLPAFEPGEALVANGATGHLYLEEYRLTPKSVDLKAQIALLARFVADDADFAARLTEQLAIVEDDLFAHFAQHCTPVAPHIAIDNARKTVKQGALWYEEVLPSDTVLYFSVSAHASRGRQRMHASEVLKAYLGLFEQGKPWLQVGGNETVGMGWCRLNPVGV